MEKEMLVQGWVMYNAKLLPAHAFERESGMTPDDFFKKHKKQCLQAWRHHMGIKEIEKTENRKKLDREKKERITAFRLEYKQATPKHFTAPVAIKQLAELHVMVSLGEFSAENFCKAFHARFGAEIQRVKNRRSKENNYGWDSIDWVAFEKSPLLSQLLA